MNLYKNNRKILTKYQTFLEYFICLMNPTTISFYIKNIYLLKSKLQLLPFGIIFFFNFSINILIILLKLINVFIYLYNSLIQNLSKY